MIVITGGQTGVDRGALEGARDAGFKTGGWAPRDFLTERGPDLALKDFGLEEFDGGYAARTKANVLRANAVVMFYQHWSPGTALTIKAAEFRNVPRITINPARDGQEARRFMADFLVDRKPAVLMIAGNRESVAPGISNVVRAIVRDVLVELRTLPHWREG